MARSRKRARRLTDAHAFPGFRPQTVVRGIFGDPKARIVTLVRRSKKTLCGVCGRIHRGWYHRRTRWVRDLSSGDTRIYLELEVRRVDCRRCGAVNRERLDFLADNPFYTKRFAYLVGRRCRSATIKDVAKELNLDWHTVKELDKQYMRAQLAHAGTPGPRRSGVDELSIRKRHTYRIVVSDLDRQRPIWFGGNDRSEASMAQFYTWLGEKKSRRIQLAVMDMWKPFRNATRLHAPQAAILFDKFHVMRHLGEALDPVRKAEYARLSGKDRCFIKGRKYALLSNPENLTLEGRQAAAVAGGSKSRCQRRSMACGSKSRYMLMYYRVHSSFRGPRA